MKWFFLFATLAWLIPSCGGSINVGGVQVLTSEEATAEPAANATPELYQEEYCGESMKEYDFQQFVSEVIAVMMNDSGKTEIPIAQGGAAYSADLARIKQNWKDRGCQRFQNGETPFWFFKLRRAAAMPSDYTETVIRQEFNANMTTDEAAAVARQIVEGWWSR